MTITADTQQPSAETIRAVAKVLRYAAFLDDRVAGADQGRIKAWASQIERHGLTEIDLMAGLQRHYDAQHERAIGIGDLITHSKQARRDRNESEGNAQREARQAHLDAIKPAPEDTQAVAAAFTAGPVTSKTQRLTDAEHELQRCNGKRESMAAIKEYLAAKADAQKGGKR